MAHETAGEGVRVRIASRQRTPDLVGVLEDTGRTVTEVGSCGVTAIEPLCILTAGGRSAFLSGCTIERLEAATRTLPEGFDAVVADADAVAEHDPEPQQVPSVQLAGLAPGERRVLGPCGWLRPTVPEDYAAAGGFVDADAEHVVSAGETITGRGWGDWAQDEQLADTWRTAGEADGEPRVVINGHGHAGDRLLLSSAPFSVLEGAQAVARAVDAADVTVFLPEDDEPARSHAQAAIESYPDPDVMVTVVTGPASSRATEPTMAVEAIEGSSRLEARLRPPGPDSVGLDGQPTVVHSARTVAHLAASLRTGDLPSTRVLHVTGDLPVTGTVEVPDSVPIARSCEGLGLESDWKAAAVGGPFGGLTDSLSVTPAPDDLAARGLGTEGTVHVLGEDRCVLKFVGERTSAAGDENCGRCVPCREGTQQLAAELRDIYDGAFDTDRFEELLDVVGSSSICHYGVAACRPTRTALRTFEDELRAHATGECPSGACAVRAEGQAA